MTDKSNKSHKTPEKKGPRPERFHDGGGAEWKDKNGKPIEREDAEDAEKNRRDARGGREQADALGTNKTLTRLAKQAGLGTGGRKLVQRLWHETREEAHDQGLEPTSENFDIYIIRSLREKLGLAVDNDIGGGTINETVHRQANDLDLPMFAEEAAIQGAAQYDWHRLGGTNGVNFAYKGKTHRLEPGDRFGVRAATSGKAAKDGVHRVVLHKHGLNKVISVHGTHAKSLVKRSKKTKTPKFD